MSVKWKRSDKFYMDSIIFRVEDTLYKVLKSYFVKNSPIFRDMFSLPQDQGTGSVDGCSDEKPLFLEGVSKSDFETLLNLMYTEHVHLDHDHKFEAHEVVPPTDQELEKQAKGLSLLRLSRRWMSTGIHALLERQLLSNEHDMKKKMSPSEKLSVGNDNFIAEWVLCAYVQFVNREEPPTSEELKLLGRDQSARIIRLGEDRLKQLDLHPFQIAFGGSGFSNKCNNG